MTSIAGVFHGSTDHVRRATARSARARRSWAATPSSRRRQAARRDPRARRPKSWIAPPTTSRSTPGSVRTPDGRTLPLAAFAGIPAEASFASSKRTYGYGAHAAEVAVDPKTGHVEVLDYVAVEDVGRIINPLTLHGQTIGAIVQGLGGVFLEHFVYDADGQLLTGSFADYLLPTASDFPTSALSRWKNSPPPTIRSAPRAPAKAASSRSPASSPTRCGRARLIGRAAARTAAVAPAGVAAHQRADKSLEHFPAKQPAASSLF